MHSAESVVHSPPERPEAEHIFPPAQNRLLHSLFEVVRVLVPDLLQLDTPALIVAADAFLQAVEISHYVSNFVAGPEGAAVEFVGAPVGQYDVGAGVESLPQPLAVEFVVHNNKAI